jgi:glycosyltransferase involved in cell wall biosynthesis
MITVLTITYNRTELLQEALKSFVLQDLPSAQMLIINDKKDLKYSTNVDNVDIINIDNRFGSLLEKLVFGIKNSKYNYVYRLDDDDLLSCKESLSSCYKYIQQNTNFDIYRSHKHYLLNRNTVSKKYAINTGNIYNKNFILSLKDLPQLDIAEDSYLNYKCNAKKYSYDFISMIYRWGITKNLTNLRHLEKSALYKAIDKQKQQSGNVELKPKWNKNYWDKISGQCS